MVYFADKKFLRLPFFSSSSKFYIAYKKPDKTENLIQGFIVGGGGTTSEMKSLAYLKKELIKKQETPGSCWFFLSLREATAI